MSYNSITVGYNSVLSVQKFQAVQFSCDIKTATFERVDNNLVLHFDSGEKTVILDYFAVNENENLPMLVLSDGTKVSGEDFLSNLGIDVQTAAGPSASPLSSGVGHYDDHTGDLIGGIDRLGGLETDYWRNNTFTPPIKVAVEDSRKGIATYTAENHDDYDGPDGPDSDTITLINANKLYGNTVYGDSKYGSAKWLGGLGDNTYIDNTASSGNTYIGGVNHNTPRIWGNDSITLKSALVEGNTVHAGQGDDAVTFTSITEGGEHSSVNNTIIGDEYAGYGTMTFGGDNIRIKGHSEGNTFYGDGVIAYDSKGKVIAGNDTVFIDGNSQNDIYVGDFYEVHKGTQCGHDDFWIWGNFIDSKVYGDGYLIGDNVLMGHDTLGFNHEDLPVGADAIISKNSSIYGDGYQIGANGTCGNDSLRFKGDMQQNTVYGDGLSLGANTVAGNDTISVDGYSMLGGLISGDAQTGSDSVRYGDDSIKIGEVRGTVAAPAVIIGDAETSGANAAFGNDLITVATNVTNAIITGDAFSSGDGAVFGHDTICIEGKVTNGWIYGDSKAAGNGTQTFGNDAIQVRTLVSGGIYGDAPESGDAIAGNNTITVNMLEGTDEKIIDGGAGDNDLFRYGYWSDNKNSVIGLGDDGKVTIDGVTDTTNTTIINFEGIGGGGGNDRLSGNSGDNVLQGGRGSDVLTGGSGADTFFWGYSDFTRGAVDTITDFSMSEQDILYFDFQQSDFAGTFTNKVVMPDHLELTIRMGWFSQEIDVFFTDSLTVDGSTYADYGQFSVAYNNAGSSEQEQMMQALILQITSFN